MAEDDSEGWQTKVSTCKAKKKEKNDDGEGEENKEKGKGSVGAEGGAPPPATSAEDQAPGTAGEPAATSLPPQPTRRVGPLIPPEGIARCSICGTVLRGGASALRTHELTSSRCQAMRSGGSEGRRIFGNLNFSNPWILASSVLVMNRFSFVSQKLLALLPMMWGQLRPGLACACRPSHQSLPTSWLDHKPSS